MDNTIVELVQTGLCEDEEGCAGSLARSLCDSPDKKDLYNVMTISKIVK
jgi:hypothetical protein